ncbi:Core-2/I-Branching enzyme [Ancylostoma caninum]|uniref:Core-2/I-Branching enzyme n=1 Tax=Ancylostoma caninum TaxID=29170 RepID=A0A368GYH2_ANCCA|nr:Core-2/I-Branching enzyme [Ancylostoma caninum]
MEKTSRDFPDILPTAIESININCEPVLSGSRGIVKYKYWTFNYDAIEKELYESENICDTIHKYFFFEKNPLSLEEQAYPLSYGLVIYKDIVQVLLELSIFYQPQNVYCITVDQGASKIYKKFVENLPKCFKNIKTFYLSGTDLPLRTNLEMVRIMKALNGSINTDVEQFEQDRYRIMEVIF